MVGDDRGRNHLEFAGAPAIEDIGKTVIGFRDQQHDPAAAGAVAHLPVHAEAFGDRGKAGLQRRQFDREIGGSEHHPHEKITGLDVVELLGVQNVLPVMGEERRYGRDDAGTIRAGQGQNELMVGHGGLDDFRETGGTAICGPALSPATALRQSRSGRQDEQTTAIGVREDHG